MAGGSGSRLWPVSRSMYRSIPGPDRVPDHAPVTAQRSPPGNPATPGLQRGPPVHRRRADAWDRHPCEIILEPVGRNTAPARAGRVGRHRRRGRAAAGPGRGPPDPDKDGFRQKSRQRSRSQGAGALVTFSVVPRTPETGWIHTNRRPSADSAGAYGVGVRREARRRHRLVKGDTSGTRGCSCSRRLATSTSSANTARDPGACPGDGTTTGDRTSCVSTVTRSGPARRSRSTTR